MTAPPSRPSRAQLKADLSLARAALLTALREIAEKRVEIAALQASRRAQALRLLAQDAQSALDEGRLDDALDYLRAIIRRLP